MDKKMHFAELPAGPVGECRAPIDHFYLCAAGKVDRPAKLRVVHYDKTRVSEGSRVRSQMLSSSAYAQGFLVLSAMKDEPWEPHWSPEVMVRFFVAARGTLGRFFQEVAAGWWMAAEARKGRFDVLHAHHNTALVAALVWVLFCNRPLIFDSHDLFAPNQTNRRSPVRRFCSWLKWGVLQRFVLGRALCGVHVSPGIVKIYRDMFPETPQVLLWNLPAFALGPDDVQQGNPIPERCEASEAPGRPPEREKSAPLRLVYFGLLTSERITLPLIRTVSSIPGVELSLYGRIYDQADDFAEYSAGFEALLKEVPVKWYGSYKTVELPAILERTDVLMHPIPVVSENNRHALPNKLFESCYNGKAILYSNVFGDLDELAQEFGFGVAFDPNDDQSVREVIGKLEADRDGVEDMKARALGLVREGPWSAAAYHQRLAEVYAGAAARLPDV